MSRADDTRTVEEAFKAIDRAQKIEFESRSHLVTTELFPWFAAPGLACMALAAFGARRFRPPNPAQPARAPA